jgi:D-aspartate ligase
MRPAAIVMNMFYTGLGIARSLGERGIPVIGLTAHRGIYGNYTRYATVRVCPDSREEPEALLPFLLKLGAELPERAIIFPTRDDDVLFLDRFRESLSRYFDLVLPRKEVVRACLDKWESYLQACQAGVESPRCWLVQGEQDLASAAEEISYPCVMKPLSSHLWRQNNNWERVGGRKAIAIDTRQQLVAEYAQISLADSRVLIQEMIPGGDDQLFIAACYLNKDSHLVASFTAQKLLQCPAGFGTGCIVQTVDRRELIEPAAALLQRMGFSGIAEVEFKWDAACGRYKLIEINPRPWEQHALGRASGVDLIYIAYCEHAGLPAPVTRTGEPGHKWVAEDVYLTTALRMIWKRDPQLGSLFSLARGKRIYGIWSSRDRRPFLIYMAKFVPQLIWMSVRQIGVALRSPFRNKTSTPYDEKLQDAKTKG